eukprot:UN22821
MKFLLLLTSFNLIKASQERCVVKFDVDICMSNATQNVVGGQCVDYINTCSRSLSFTHVQLEPYMIEIIHDLVHRCCGVCPSNNYTDKRISDVSKIPDVGDNNSTDFVFPVLGLNSARKMFGYHFIPFIQPPSLYYYTAADRQMLGKNGAPLPQHDD